MNMENACLIIGCGKIAAKHATCLRGKVLLYFYSSNSDDSKRFNDKFHGEGVFESWEEVLNNRSIPNWIICSPLGAHHDQIVSGIELNKNILCEKPLCLNRDELTNIEKKLANSSNEARLMVAENYYYKPIVSAIKSIVENGGIGKIEMIHLKKEFLQSSYGWREQYGALLEGGIHFIALANAIIQKKVLKVVSTIDKTIKPERASKTEICYENNVKAEISYSWVTPSLTKGVFQHSKIIGNNGTIFFESNGIYLLQIRRNIKIVFPNLFDLTGEMAMLNDFLKFINDQSYVPISSFKNAVRDLEIVFGAYELNDL